MDEQTLRIREWATEARSRNKQNPIRLDVDVVMGDIDFLLDQVAALKVENRSLEIKGDRLARETGRSAGFRDELVTERENNKELRKELEARIANGQSTMVSQINEAMNALTDAGIPERGGKVTSRIARRIQELSNRKVILANRSNNAVANLEAETKKLAAAEVIIAETHEALTAANVPVGRTLLGRVAQALDERAGKPRAGCTFERTEYITGI